MLKRPYHSKGGRLLAGMLLAVTLLLPRPAMALVDPISIATNVIGLSLTPAGWATSIGAAVRIAVESYFETIMSAIKAKGEFDADQAEAVVETHIEKRALQLGFQIANMRSPNESTCRAATATRRQQQSEAENTGDNIADYQARLAAIEQQGLRAAGGSAGTPTPPSTGGPGTIPRPTLARGLGPSGARLHAPGGQQTADAIQERELRCRSGAVPNTPDGQRECRGVTEARLGVAPQADVDANFFLNALAFDNQTHEDMAKAYCRNLTFNRTLEIPLAGEARRSVDGTRRSQTMYAERAAASLASMICDQALASRRPRGGDYTAFTAMVNAAATDNCDSESNTQNRLYCQRLRKFGWSPIASAAEAQPGAQWPLRDAAGTISGLNANAKFVPGRSPSVALGRVMSVNALSEQSRLVGSNVNTKEALFHLILARTVLLGQEFAQQRNLEKQLLFEAVRLARATHNRGS